MVTLTLTLTLTLTSVDVCEISEIVPGVATEVARRSGKGKEALFLSVITPARTLDLEP